MLPFAFKPMPRPRSADAPSFDGTNLTNFLDVLSRHGEHAGLDLDGLAPLIVAYCTPDVQRVILHVPELQRNARSWRDAVSELRSLYGSLDNPVTYTIADLHQFCRGSCSGPPFRSLSDAEAYLRCYTQISGYLHEFGFISALELQVYLVAGLPVATRKEVEARLPDANRGTDSPPTKRQVVHILRDLLRRDSFDTFVANRLLPTRSPSSPSSSDAPNPPASQPRADSQPKPRSQRCFVCGGTGTHRLSPKFCPRTWELIEHRLARFDPNGRLASHDGSPLPMTRNTGGVAAHLFACLDRRRHHSQKAPHVASQSIFHDVHVPAHNTSSNSKPPQSLIALRRPPSPLLPPTSLASNIDADTLSPPRSNLNSPHYSSPPRVRTVPVIVFSPNSSYSASDEIDEPHTSTPSHHAPPHPNFDSNPPYLSPPLPACIAPVVASASNPQPSASNEIDEPRPASPTHSQSSISPPFPSYIRSPPHNSAPGLSDLDVDPKQLVTLSFADLLAISPPMRAKVAAFIHHLDSKSVSKPVCDPPSVPVTPSHIPCSFNSARKFFVALLSSLVLVLITWAFSTYVTSSSKHLGSYGYLTDIISFLLSHVTHLLMDSILF
ncbi:hypothetical protein B0H14DRAFT_3060036 [Mycena olivaceomarginata]|nr:hypothetical protein B0H14DRAFT_3060036 [Mycena olivaceomarginata]